MHDALFEMDPLKAPRIDRLHAQFYQSQWSVVGESLVLMVQKRFLTGEVEAFLNKTLIVLIPKVLGSEVVSHFRPINLCTVPYKVLTKVIVNRLKPLMPQLVAKNQTSFVGGRHIMDNVVVAQEVIHSTKIKKGKKGWMAIKIDMEKAYDRLRWGFLEETLEKAKISHSVVHLILNCVSTSIIQVLWNGGFTNEFAPSRGVRQGNPLSPYLLILMMERLGHVIMRAIS